MCSGLLDNAIAFIYRMGTAGSCRNALFLLRVVLMQLTFAPKYVTFSFFADGTILFPFEFTAVTVNAANAISSKAIHSLFFDLCSNPFYPIMFLFFCMGHCYHFIVWCRIDDVFYLENSAISRIRSGIEMDCGQCFMHAPHATHLSAHLLSGVSR